MRKTKIICTLGPATDEDGVLCKLMEEGMDVARFNFSHGSYEEHERRMFEVVKLRNLLNKPVAMMLDTKGPEIRLKCFKDHAVELKQGDHFTLTGREVSGTKDIVSITYDKLYQDVVPGTKIWIDDGMLQLEVESIDGEDVKCLVKNDGTISDCKGVNVPGVHINIEYLSEKDKEDILFGMRHDVDFIAASFVRCAADIRAIRTLLKENGETKIKLIAKIENREGVDHIDEIIEEADGIMIARGDMGIELPGEEVPIIQKMIIRKVYESGKQVITATQMLDSMMKNPRPTRAEIADVANAIYDGTSATMLSGETAAGKYPVESVSMMARIANYTEQAIDYKQEFANRAGKFSYDITNAIGHATCTTAYDLNAKAIVAVTKSGRAARMISKYRPACDIIGGTTDKKVCRQLNLSWGVTPILLEEKTDVFGLFAHALEEAKRKGYMKRGDIAVITSGVPIGISGTTNMLKVEAVE